MTTPARLGRPPKYGDEIIQKTIEYIGGDFINQDFGVTRTVVPTLHGLATYLDVTLSTVFEWQHTHPIFSEHIESLKQIQHDLLVNGGLTGQFNSTIAKLILSKHGYSERLDLNANHMHSGKVEVQPATFVGVTATSGATIDHQPDRPAIEHQTDDNGQRLNGQGLQAGREDRPMTALERRRARKAGRQTGSV